MRHVSRGTLLLSVLAAGVTPLVCVLPMLSGATGRAVILVLLACLALVGTVGLLKMRRESRHLTAYEDELSGVCPRCGYDMRATPDQCPECGRVKGEGFE